MKIPAIPEPRHEVTLYRAGQRSKLRARTQLFPTVGPALYAGPGNM